MISLHLFGAEIYLEYVLLALFLLSGLVLSIRERNAPIHPLHPASLIATFFHVGRIPVVPGTWGTLAGMYALLHLLLLPRRGIIDIETMLALLVGGFMVTYLIGHWATRVYMEKTKTHDPGRIVIDEVLGIWLTVMLVLAVYGILLQTGNREFLYILMLSPWFALALFVLFRLFDILKPWHIGWCDRELEDAHGVILDDIVAGFYTAITFFILFFLLYFSGGFLWIFRTFFPDWMGMEPPERVY